MMRTPLATAAVLSALFVARVAVACQCGIKPDAETALAQSELVVGGVVTQLHTTELKNGNGQTFIQQKAAFSVRRWWKGPKETTISLSQESNCSLFLSEGTAYLLFLKRVEGGGYEATLCSPSKPWRLAKHDLETIGPGELLGREPSDPPNPPLQPTGVSGG